MKKVTHGKAQTARPRVSTRNTGKGAPAGTHVRSKASADPAKGRTADDAGQDRQDVAGPGTGALRTSRGSTEREWSASQFKTGQLGVELAKSNDRVRALLIAGGHLSPDGKTLQRVIDQAEGRVSYPTVTRPLKPLYDEKLAQMGRAIANLPKPEIKMPEPGYKSEMYRAPVPMAPEVKQKLRDMAKPKDNGDHVAGILRGCEDLDEVYRVGAKFLKVKEADLRKQYGHLNPGQQRMNVGNRMRGFWRKQQESKK